MGRLTGQTALVTGASAGIGRATALALAAEGARIVASARRRDRLDALCQEIVASYGASAAGVLEMDVQNREDVRGAIQNLEQAGWGEIDILVNNAGLAAGLEPVQEGLFDDWDRMIDTNVTGLLNVTRFVVPGMLSRGRGHVVNIGSVAGREIYPNGAVYCASKAAVDMINKGLRLDTLGRGLRVTCVRPGMLQSEFSLVRFHGDTERAQRVYENANVLQPEDVADAVVYAVTRPPHVNIEEILVMSTDQASTRDLHRGS